MFKYNKQSIFESVSVLLQRISLTIISMWFSFTIKLLIDPGKVFDYFEEERTTTILRNRPWNPHPFKSLYFYLFFEFLCEE